MQARPRTLSRCRTHSSMLCTYALRALDYVDPSGRRQEGSLVDENMPCSFEEAEIWKQSENDNSAQTHFYENCKTD